MSLSLALAPFEWKATDGETYKVNLIDTPGYADFVGDVDAALSVADLAVLVVSAVDGIEVGTESAWAQVRRAPASRGMVFVNKEDKPRADFHRVLDAAAGHVRVRLRAARAAARRGGGAARHRRRAHRPGLRVRARRPATTPSRSRPTSPTRSTACTTSSSRRSSSGDDEQLERYLSGDVPTAAELERTLAHEVLDRLEFPVLVRLGAHRRRRRPAGRLHLRARPVAGRPADDGRRRQRRRQRRGRGRRPTRRPSRWPTCSRRVADQFVGQVSLFKVLSGTVAVDDRLVNTDERHRGAPARPVPPARQGAPHRRPGRRRRHRRRRQARRHRRPARRWRRRTRRCASPPPSRRRPSFGLALKPVTQSDDDKLSGALQRLLAEDPALAVDRNEETGQTVLRGCGDTHLAVALERLARKFGVNVETEDVRVPYRETIIGIGRGRGQGQEAVRRPRPVRRRQPAGQPDGARRRHRVRQLDRRRHDPASSTSRPCSAASRRRWPPAACTASPSSTCASSATTASSTPSTPPTWRSARPPRTGFKEALQKAGAAVLEPISLLTVTVPEGYQGDVLGDLNARRGRVSGTQLARRRRARDRRPRARRPRSSATPSSCAR